MAGEERYPEILAELAAIIGEGLQRRGIDAQQAAELGQEAAEYLRDRWSGQTVYLPKGLHYDLERRDLEIWQKFNGHNQVALAREYGLTEIRIYQILKRVRAVDLARRQPELFPKEAGR